MTEADLVELGFVKQIQDACCDPQIYSFYKIIGNSVPFTTPSSDTIENDSWAVENYGISFKTLIKSELVDMITLIENNPLFPSSE